ncbi:MAG TPA: hypothetical protein VLD36_04560 [Burkholderiales bacterium]|nr:hypothetical protein [Burkholderiales bacterium]
MAGLSEHQAAFAATRAERDAARAGLRAASGAVDASEAELAALRRQLPGNPDLAGRIAALDRALADRRRAVDQARGRLGGFDAKLGEMIGDAGLADPSRLIEQLDDRTPFLLLPVRLETRFWNEGEQHELRVRIFPDTIAVTAHEDALTTGEVDAARGFWRRRADAARLGDENARRLAEEGAWTTLVHRYTEGRAAYLVRRQRPTNWDAEPRPLPEALIFPDPGEPAPESAGSVPRSFVMPDRFAIITIAGGAVIHQVFGKPIPDDLILGPDPEQLEAKLDRDGTTGRLVTDPKLRWLFDFDTAVEVGLALRIPLEMPWPRSGFDRVVALGLRLTSDADEAAARVARLIAAHRFTAGFDLVPPGTPTNNNEDTKSGFTTALAAGVEAMGEALDEAVAVPTLDHPNKSDVQRLAEALGLGFDSVKSLPSAKRMDIAEALAMNRALWPATLGAYARNFIASLLPEASRASLERFALTYVTGRGLLPSIRTASQPYGVLVTSALPRFAWSEGERGRDAAFLGALDAANARLTADWRALAAQVARVSQGDRGFAAFMNVLGLQAASAGYGSRKAVTDEHAWNLIVWGGFARFLRDNWWDYVTATKRANLLSLGLNPDDPNLRIEELTFLRSADILDGPVVDRDPAVPLSERDPILPFDGTRNYIHWLTTASWQDIEAQRFLDAGGKALPAPAALLYLYLRHAWLAELRHTTLKVLAIKDATLFAAIDPEPAIVNVGADPTLVHGQLLNIDAAKINAADRSSAVGAVVLDRARAKIFLPDDPPELLQLASLADSLRRLASLPTARLERLFAEHVDVCGYRLDAWHLGMFNRRLDFMRRDNEGRTRRGVYLGAYGVVENLRPSRVQRVVVDPQTLPEKLRDPGVTVVERRDNGGYVHAPSLTHAVSAAILRNGYLSHATPEQPQTLALNLSSARVREAMGLIEGLRNGQELAALLGYQLERGLHENHPGIELDALIYTLRERFPFTSRKLTPVPDGTAAEVIEARNVINGVDLLEFVRGKAYPYGLAGLPAAGSAEASAVVAEFDALAAALDAHSDLMLAESVHQIVQGNYDRARGVLQAMGEAEMPPLPDIVATPRSGRSLLQRVAIFAAGGAGWTGTPPTSPRAAANARLNRWLVTMLPAPSAIAVRVTAGGSPSSFLTLAALNLDALETVLMIGETLGESSSELERYIADHVRMSLGIDDEQPVTIDATAAPAVAQALATLLPLLRALRELVTKARPLDASDLRLAGESHRADPANPRGLDAPAGPRHDLQDLEARALAAIAAVDAPVNSLKTVLEAPALIAAFTALEADPSTFDSAFWTPRLASLRAALRALARLGMAEALPASAFGTTVAAVKTLVPQARNLARLGAERSALAVKLATPPPVTPPPADPAEAARARGRALTNRAAALGEAIKAVLGNAMVALPLFGLGDDHRAEVVGAFANPASSDALAIETWLQSLSRVRAPLAALAWLGCYREAIGAQPLSLTPIQLPLRAGDPWIGGATGSAELPSEVLSVVAIDAPADPGADLAGLMLDDWSEVVPTDKETTGVAFHFDRPNAAPPQALLLAVPPVLRGGWRWDDLVATITDTVDRARLRAVEPDQLMNTPYAQLLPTTLVEFSTGGLFLSTLLVENALVANAAAPPA